MSEPFEDFMLWRDEHANCAEDMQEDSEADDEAEAIEEQNERNTTRKAKTPTQA